MSLEKKGRHLHTTEGNATTQGASKSVFFDQQK